MALDTYANLKSSVSDWLNRADLAAVVPDFITLAEAQMARMFVKSIRQGVSVPRRLFARTDLSLANAAEFANVPSDFVGPLDVMLTATGCLIETDYLTQEAFQREKTRGFWTGPPKFYTVVGSQLQFYPIADQIYTAELSYISRPAVLSNSNPDNWVLTNFPDAYLYGALAQSAPYLKEDARITTWAALFTAAVNDICMSDPMPTNKAKLRTDAPRSRDMMWRGTAYNITSDQ